MQAHLCLNITMKGHMIVPGRHNRNLQENTIKTMFSNLKKAWKFYSILSSCRFKVILSILDSLRFLEMAKNMFFFGPILAFYSIRAVTTWTVVDCGSPRLCITKSSRANWYGNLVPDDS